MWISISEASRSWGISRTTIHAKLKQKHLSKDENGLIDPAEMSRVFGSPKKKIKKSNDVQNIQKTQEITAQDTLKTLFEKQLDFERKLRLQAEKQAQEYKEKVQQAEQRLDKALQQMDKLTDTIRLLEAPKSESKPRKKFLGIF